MRWFWNSCSKFGLLAVLMCVAIPVWANEIQMTSLEQTSTRAADLMAQPSGDAAIVQITGVKLNRTDAGIEVVLETENGAMLQSTTQTIGNALIADFPNAALAEALRESNPTEGIALVEVTDLPGNRVRVAITGTDAPPIAEIITESRGLVLSVAAGTTQAEAPEDEIQVFVTGEQETGYRVPNATTATRTDTPIRDIPQSIQVIPQQVLEDQQITRIGDAVQNVSGVVNGGSYSGIDEQLLIRGFALNTFGNGNYFRDGIRLYSLGLLETANIQQIEVLKGPASVMFGQAQPGGVINLVTKQPLSDPYYLLEATVGNFDTYQGGFDLSGPLNADETILYRLNGFYENADSFRESVDSERYFAAPSLTLNLGENTSLRLNTTFLDSRRTTDDGIPAIGDRPADIPHERFLGESFNNTDLENYSIGYIFNHRFNENLSIRHTFQAEWLNRDTVYPLNSALNEATGGLERLAYANDEQYQVYSTQTDIINQFNTGSIEHQLLLGFEYTKFIEISAFQFTDPYPSINIFDPVQTRERYPIRFSFFRDDDVNTTALYIQDQINLLPNLILLAGGRLDFVDQDRRERNSGEPKQQFEQSDSAFSPRVGLVYQPNDDISLYASYTSSFLASFGTSRNPDGTVFEPQEGRQFEIGVKADLFDDAVSATLAAYNLTKSNVSTPDPNNPNFSIQVGEQRSRGIEFDLTGELLSGWNIIASAAYTDAFVNRDNTFEEGNRLVNVPEFSASLWTTYEIQTGDLSGLGFGLGLYYVGDRQGDLNNSYILPSYFRTDVALFYRRENWRMALNVRNLFDTEYFAGSDGGRLQIQPGAPFTILGSLTYEF